MKRKKRILITDMDGVVLLTEILHGLATIEVFENHGMELTMDHFERYTGIQSIPTFTRLLSDFNRSDLDVHTLIAEYQAVFRRRVPKEAVVAEGATEFYRWVKTEVDKLGLCTSTEEVLQKQLCDLAEISELLDAVVCGDDERLTNGKPDPEPYLLLFQLLGVDPEKDDIYIIEDSGPGVTAAVASGAKVIALTTTITRAELEALNPAIIVDNFAEVRTYLEREFAA